MVHLIQRTLLLTGVEAWNTWRNAHPEIQPELAEADLGAEGDIERVHLGGANLSNAKLRRANLYGAFLGSANLRHADLSQATLTGVDLTGTDLSYASLREADGCRATFFGATLNGRTCAMWTSAKR